MWSSEYSFGVLPRICAGELYIVTRGYWPTAPRLGGHLPTGRRAVAPAGFGPLLVIRPPEVRRDTRRGKLRCRANGDPRTVS